MTRRDHYRRIRAEVDDLASRIEWTFDWSAGRSLGVGRVDDIEIRVYNDDEPYDTGDCELSEDDWRELEVIGVAVGLPGEDDLESVWGVAYLDHDIEGNALTTAVECGYLDAARREMSERAAWAARGVVTVA